MKQRHPFMPNSAAMIVSNAERSTEDRIGPYTRTRGAPTPATTTSPALADRGTICSVSRRGNCYENAVVEICFSTAKSELGERFDSKGQTTMRLFECIEVFYNQKRQHSAPGRISQAAFERRVTQAA